MRTVAFAYMDAAPQLKAVYRACAEGLVENLKAVMPGVPILHVTDDKSAPVAGCSVLRIPDAPLMVWRLAAHYCAHQVADEILFTEPDVRFAENILHLFDEDDFDVALADREGRTSYYGREITDELPYTQGSTLSRNAQFWKDAAKHCKTLDRKSQLWMGDMMSIAHVVRSGSYKVRVLSAKVYNHIPERVNEQSDAKVIHYKGKRKTWLFPMVQEAA